MFASAGLAILLLSHVDARVRGLGLTASPDHHRALALWSVAFPWSPSSLSARPARPAALHAGGAHVTALHDDVAGTVAEGSVPDAVSVGGDASSYVEPAAGPRWLRHVLPSAEAAAQQLWCEPMVKESGPALAF